MERAFNRVILHCSATPDDNQHDYSAAAIDLWHKQRGWTGIGYHFVIRRSGKIEEGRDINKIGAHTKGHNTDSIGVCYIGTRRPTKEQIEAFLILFKKLRDEYKIEANNWFGHYEFNGHKECPSIPMHLVRGFLGAA